MVVVAKNRCLVTKNRPPERPHHAHLKKRAGEARLRNFNSPWSSVPGNPASIVPVRSASSIAKRGVKHSLQMRARLPSRPPTTTTTPPPPDRSRARARPERLARADSRYLSKSWRLFLPVYFKSW